jgi:hypothetical protein
MSTTPSEVLEALRRADEDNRSRAAEINALRAKLAEADRATAAATEARDRAEHRAASAQAEVERQTQALGVVLKEVTTTKDLLRVARDENARLRESLDHASSQSQQMRNLLSVRSTNDTYEGSVAHSGAVVYMQRCFSLRAEPALGVLRSLHDRSADVDASAASFQQLAVLLDVVRTNPASVTDVIGLDVTCNGETATVVADLVAAMPHIRRITARGVDDTGVECLAAAVRLRGQVQELHVLRLAATDTGVLHLLRAMSERLALAKAGSCAPLRLPGLNLSECRIEDAPSTLEGLADPSLEHLDLSGIASLDKSTLRAVLMKCPSVTHVTLRGCGKLSSDVCEVLNLCPAVVEVDLTGSTNVTAIRLDHVRLLRTSLVAVAALNCPKLVELPDPCDAFQVVEWHAPLLETITLRGVSLSAREFTLLSQCQIRNLAVVGSRVTGLDTLLKRMRRLEVMNLNGSKGVTDADIRSVCTTLVSADLTDSFCVTDKAMGRLAECPKLQELTLKRCANVSDHGLLAFEGHESLRYLNVLGAKKVTILSIHRLLEHGKNLQHIVHESIVATNVRVDRTDQEEAQRRTLTTQEKALHNQITNLSMSAVLASPNRPHSPRGTTSAAGSSLFDL